MFWHANGATQFVPTTQGQCVTQLDCVLIQPSKVQFLADCCWNIINWAPVCSTRSISSRSLLSLPVWLGGNCRRPANGHAVNHWASLIVFSSVVCVCVCVAPQERSAFVSGRKWSEPNKGQSLVVVLLSSVNNRPDTGPHTREIGATTGRWWVSKLCYLMGPDSIN